MLALSLTVTSRMATAGSPDDALLHALAEQRAALARGGPVDAAQAADLCARCDALAEAACGRGSLDFAHSLQWSAEVLARVVEAKGGAKKAKKEALHALALLRESAATLAAVAGEAHPETASALFQLAAALASSGAKPDAQQAHEVHARAMAAFWRAHAQPQLGELSIAQLAAALAEAHLGMRARAGGAQSDARAVGALLRDALAFEEAGGAGEGGPLTPEAHALRAALVRVFDAAGELPAALAAAEAACECAGRGLSPLPAARAAAEAAPPAPKGKASPEEEAAQLAALEAAKAAKAAEAERHAAEEARAHAEAWAAVARLRRKAGEFGEALRAEREALALVAIRPAAHSAKRPSLKAAPQPAQTSARNGWHDGPLAAGASARAARDALRLALGAAGEAPLTRDERAARFEAALGAVEKALQVAREVAGGESAEAAQVRRPLANASRPSCAAAPRLATPAAAELSPCGRPCPLATCRRPPGARAVRRAARGDGGQGGRRGRGAAGGAHPPGRRRRGGRSIPPVHGVSDASSRRVGGAAGGCLIGKEC